jgi:hypothetical protein
VTQVRVLFLFILYTGVFLAVWIIAFIQGSFHWLQVKEMLKREVQKAENESNRNTAIITEYKQVKWPENIK